ncbi:MAG: HEAT repeat domain-containing protein [Armatimonadota bacterium]
MSRSIHTNRKDIIELARWKYADPEVRRAEAQELWADVRRKRRAKRQVKGERAAESGLIVASEVESIPISMRDAGQFVHFPTSPDDVRNVMRLLPGGSLDGLARIELCLGAEYQKDPSVYDPEDGYKPDPLVGRIGDEMLPGIYRGHCLGYYSRPHSVIRVFAYVYDPEKVDVRLWEVYLRLQMLATVVHEIAHSVDLTTRVAKDRWLADDKSKVEMYAEKLEYSWLMDCVVPYLETKYSDETTALLDWIEYYGGDRISLALLAGEPRRTGTNGMMRLVIESSEALHDLARSVADGKGLRESRLDFARYLHYAEMNSEALRIVDRVVAECSSDAEALTLRADVLYDLEEYEQSRVAAEQAISLDADSEDAWTYLSFAHTELGNWYDVIRVTTHLLDHFNLRKGLKANTLVRRAHAMLNTGDLHGMKRDLELVTQASETPFTRWQVTTVRALHEAWIGMDGTKKMSEATEENERPTSELVAKALAVLPDREDAYWDSVRVLWMHGDNEVFEEAKRLCSSEKAPERQLGVDILGQLGVPERKFAGESVRIITEMLRKQGLLRKEQDPNVLYSIGIALGHLGDPKAVKPLAGMSEHPCAAVRYGVAFGLCGHKNKLAVKVLIELSSDPYAFVRNWATSGLARQIDLDTPAIREALVQRVDDEDDDTRAEALIGLAARKDERVIEPLILKLGRADVSESVIEAAEKMANPRLHPALAELSRIREVGVK